MSANSRADSESALAVIIVSYNCRDALRACLRSLPDGPRAVVVDNASNDDTAAMVRREFPGVTLLANPENRGFAAACNQGLATSTEEFALLLNPDTQVSDGALRTLLRAMANDPQLGACGPRILNADGSLQASWRAFPTLAGLVIDELGLGYLLAKLGGRTGYRLSGQGGHQAREVPQLGGACLLLRRAALNQVGWLDERFFVYFEEVDLCLRLKQLDWRVRYVADAVITHTGGQSSRSDRAASLMHRYRSLMTFLRKYHPRWQLPLLKSAVFVGALLRTLAGQRHYAAVAGGIWKI